VTLDTDLILQILSSVNLTVASAIVLTAFSLLIYIVGHNFRNEVARAFCALLVFVTFVYCGDVMVANTETPAAVVGWLKLQWFGIAFVPAAYLHFSSAVARTTGQTSRGRSMSVVVGYVLGIATLAAVLFTDLIVVERKTASAFTNLQAGPLFWVFALYFVVATLAGAWNIRDARRRALTQATRRRMTYLAIAFVAPALGAFPYLLVASLPAKPIVQGILGVLLFVGNVAVAMMIVVMGYTVAYFGALTPDRVIKHSLIHYLLRGPFVGTCVLALILLTPDTQRLLGLSRETFLVFSTVGLIVVLQLLINVAKPFIDRLIYSQDRDEISWIQELDKRLLTSSDLQQFLENILTAVCEHLRVGSGFVALVNGGQLQAEAKCGPQNRISECLETWKPRNKTTTTPEAGSRNGRRLSLRHEDIELHDSFWMIQLRSKDRQQLLGVMGVEARIYPLSEEELSALEAMVAQAEVALEDRLLQQNVFVALKQIIPEIDQIQRWRSAPMYAPLPAASSVRVDEEDPEFQKAVKDALSHLWGGPKLTHSPLLELQVVAHTLDEADANPGKALRATLSRAIERLQPAGDRSYTAPEWLLYNILEMKFIQRKKTREIAHRLAMSESDLYRKQRVAVEEVAKTLVTMEREAVQSQ